MLLHRLRGHTDFVFSVSFSHDDRYLASGGDDKKVIIWDAESGGHADPALASCACDWVCVRALQDRKQGIEDMTVQTIL